MKLRYYIRGLAVGIFVATLILSIANIGKKPLTDAQIRERALALGMVDADSVKLSDLQNKAESSAEAVKPVESKPEESKTEESKPEETKVEESKPEESSVEPVESSIQETVETSENTAAVTIQIKSGANSYTVSKDLASKGLVEDAKAYDDFLCKNGYASKIHVGTYEIMPGTSGEEIAKMIAY